MGVIHIRDKNLPSQPLHFESRTEHLQLTDDPNLVTCKRCLAMMKRAKDFAGKEVIPPAPTVYCPKDGEQVPIWYCLGSLTQGRERCSHIVKATVHGGESAEVECKWRLDKASV